MQVAAVGGEEDRIPGIISESQRLSPLTVPSLWPSGLVALGLPCLFVGVEMPRRVLDF